MSPYENLANAIIIQAAKDYRKALKSLKSNPKNWKAKAMADECESFFLSGYFQLLSQVDGEMLMNKLKAESQSE